MSKRKKKPNSSGLQKISKAHQRNEFIAHIKQFCDNVTNSHVFALIPQQELEHMYNLRCRSTRIIAASNQKVPPHILKEFKWFISNIFATKQIHIGIGNVTEISFQDYFTHALTLMLYAAKVKEDAYPNATKVKQALAPLVTLAESDFYGKAWQDYWGVMNTSSILNGDLIEGLHVAKYELRNVVAGDVGFFPFMEIYRMQPEKIQVLIDGAKRPAYKLGWFLPEPAPHFLPLTIKSEQLNLQAGFSLDIYIQAHALSRLAERMDGLLIGFLHYSIFESFQNAKVCKNKKGDLLFEYRFFGKKTGYFKGDVIDGKLILRTFLFLTNNGTPEGEKLHDDTGIEKEDKIYLTIDKLSTFINSDIESNPRLKEMFLKAGCASIFEIDRSLYMPSTKEKTIAAFIVQYLGLDKNMPNPQN